MIHFRLFKCRTPPDRPHQEKPELKLVPLLSLLVRLPEMSTVSNKTVPITNPNTVREVHCNNMWEFRLALV